MLVVTWLCTALSFVTVHGLFMDMYNELFQIELLDDCSFYVYDRVIPSRDSEWCNQPKSSMFPMEYRYYNIKDPTTYMGVFAIYADKNDVVHAYLYHSDKRDLESQGNELISQKFYEAGVGIDAVKGSIPQFTETVGGRYEIVGFRVTQFFTIRYLACKYSQPKNDFCRVVRYNLSDESVSVKSCGKDSTCDPLTHIDAKYNINNNYFTVKVVEVPGSTKLRRASVNGRVYDLSSIKASISTAMMDPRVFPDFRKSFPTDIFTTELKSEQPAEYNSVILNGDKFSAVGESEMVTYTYETPDENYDDRPFFYYNKNTGQYTPFFLTYQSKGLGLSFTLRILADGQFHKIFDETKYINICGFNNFQSTIAAAPRILSQTSEMFNVEIFFFTNDKAFKYCILDVKYYYQFKNYTLDAPENSGVNSYVHAQTRSTKAANCVFGENRRKRREGFAFTKHQDDRSKDVGQLFSLSDDVSSPLFPCPGCDETTDILCDVNPTAAVTYDAAYFLLTVKGDKTQVVYIGVKRKGYQKYIEYRIDQVDGRVYFLQQVSLQIEAKEMYAALRTGNFKSEHYDENDQVDDNAPVPTIDYDAILAQRKKAEEAEEEADSLALLNRVPVISLIALGAFHVFDF